MSMFDDDLEDYPIPPVNGCARGLLIVVVFEIAVVILFVLALRAAG